MDGEKNHYLSEKLEALEQGLSTTEFVRIHRSYLINIDKVKEIQRWFNGKLMVFMNDSAKTELSTSRAGADKLKKYSTYNDFSSAFPPRLTSI